MNISDAAEVLQDIPHIHPKRGAELYHFILDHECRNILELGFAHGTSTCYMAAALDELGGGSILTIDQPSALERSPNIHALLGQLSLERFVTPIFSETSYIWELKKLIERHTVDGRCEPPFDFIFIDGAHTWEVDGFAFFLSEKLLKPACWILFDDLLWSYGSRPIMKNLDWVKQLPAEMRDFPQIEMVFQLLVCQHPHIDITKRDNNWGWARKRPL